MKNISEYIIDNAINTNDIMMLNEENLLNAITNVFGKGAEIKSVIRNTARAISIIGKKNFGYGKLMFKVMSEVRDPKEKERILSFLDKKFKNANTPEEILDAGIEFIEHNKDGKSDFNGALYNVLMQIAIKKNMRDDIKRLRELKTELKDVNRLDSEAKKLNTETNTDNEDNTANTDNKEISSKNQEKIDTGTNVAVKNNEKEAKSAGINSDNLRRKIHNMIWAASKKSIDLDDAEQDEINNIADGFAKTIIAGQKLSDTQINKDILKKFNIENIDDFLKTIDNIKTE